MHGFPMHQVIWMLRGEWQRLNRERLVHQSIPREESYTAHREPTCRWGAELRELFQRPAELVMRNRGQMSTNKQCHIAVEHNDKQQIQLYFQERNTR